ncbi:hypothetical protein Ocin01_01183 [Orchesella cincta]|uniref:Uncharacterized protein n=1 Tax=Orchesella cincta TaxID=48709 RepID=A0A1D2NJU3_ORCCI|nr:hypothetical protein Ocin01_01183 [Orchesella cincta]
MLPATTPPPASPKARRSSSSSPAPAESRSSASPRSNNVRNDISLAVGLTLSNRGAIHHQPLEKLDAQKLDAAYFSKHDVANKFLESLASMTRKDFEHAAALEDSRNGNLPASPRPPTPPVSGAKKSAGNSRFVVLQGRPASAPIGNRRSQRNGRPSSASGPHRALTKTKLVSPAFKHKALELVKSKPVSANASVVSSANTSNSALAFESDSDRPDSASSVNRRVTFAADVVNYERENKPSKRRKLPKRRKQGFPHPSRGIFVPPEWEIVDTVGPATASCRKNPYLSFNQVWTHPAVRQTGDGNTALVIRKERFHRLMTDLETSHHLYNRLTQDDQDIYLIHCIFKRYICALDLALTDANLSQTEHLLETIGNSAKVLQRCMHNEIFILESNPTSEAVAAAAPTIVRAQSDNPDLALLEYALMRVTDGRKCYFTDGMCIETILMKLCLEMVGLVFAPKDTHLFKIVLASIPYTASQASTVLRSMMNNRQTLCYIKWINNSPVQRDFRSIMKNFLLLDRYGCKAEVPEVELPSWKHRGTRLRNVYTAPAAVKLNPKNAQSQ